MKCDYVEIGNKIRKIRQSHNYSQAMFAEMLNISREQVARIEAATRIPSLEVLMSVAEFAGISLDYLVTGSDVQSSTKKQLRDIIDSLSSLERLL